MRAYLYEGWPSQRGKKQSLLAVLRGPVAFFYCILLAHVFAVFGVSVPAGAWIVIYAGLCIYPYLTVRGWRGRCLGLGRTSCGGGRGRALGRRASGSSGNGFRLPLMLVWRGRCGRTRTSCYGLRLG